MRSPAPSVIQLPVHNRQLEGGAASVHYHHSEVDVPGVKQPVAYTLAIPEELQSDTLSVGVNGFAATKPTFKRFMGALASRYGIMTLHYDPARSVGSRFSPAKSLFDPQQLHHDTIERVVEHAQTNSNVAKLPNGTTAMHARLALLLHSMGELPGTSFALASPNNIDAVVHMGGAGIEGSSGLKLLPRTGRMLLHDVVPGVLSGRFGLHPELARRSAHYFLANPLQVVGEIASCMAANIQPRIEQLAERGTYQAFVGFENDQYFPVNDSVAAISGVMQYTTILENCPHTGPQVRPYYTAKHVGQILLERPGSA